MNVKKEKLIGRAPECEMMNDKRKKQIWPVVVIPKTKQTLKKTPYFNLKQEFFWSFSALLVPPVPPASISSSFNSIIMTKNKTNKNACVLLYQCRWTMSIVQTFHTGIELNSGIFLVFQTKITAPHFYYGNRNLIINRVWLWGVLWYSPTLLENLSKRMAFFWIMLTCSEYAHFDKY